MATKSSCRAVRKKLPGEALGIGGRHVLFVNYDGADIRASGQLDGKPRHPRSWFQNQGIIELDGFAPSSASRAQDIAKIHQQVQKWYADFDIDVVMSRPLSGDSPNDAGRRRQDGHRSGRRIVGISPATAKQQRDQPKLRVFALAYERPDQVAVTIAHEAGHAYGLGHVQNQRTLCT